MYFNFKFQFKSHQILNKVKLKVKKVVAILKSSLSQKKLDAKCLKTCFHLSNDLRISKIIQLVFRRQLFLLNFKQDSKI
jgi:hypothetical protein